MNQADLSKACRSFRACLEACIEAEGGSLRSNCKVDNGKHFLLNKLSHSSSGSPDRS